MSEELKPLDKPWDTAQSESIWDISGIYPDGGSFIHCLAIVAPFYMTGTDEPLFMMISPAIQDGKAIASKWITDAEPLVLMHKGYPPVAFYEDDQSQVKEMKNAWVEEVAGRVEKLTCFCNTFKQMMIDSGHANVSLPDYQCQRCEVLATIKEMKG